MRSKKVLQQEMNLEWNSKLKVGKFADKNAVEICIAELKAAKEAVKPRTLLMFYGQKNPS